MSRKFKCLFISTEFFAKTHPFGDMILSKLVLGADSYLQCTQIYKCILLQRKTQTNTVFLRTKDKPELLKSLSRNFFVIEPSWTDRCILMCRHTTGVLLALVGVTHIAELQKTSAKSIRLELRWRRRLNDVILGVFFGSQGQTFVTVSVTICRLIRMLYIVIFYINIFLRMIQFETR